MCKIKRASFTLLMCTALFLPLLSLFNLSAIAASNDVTGINSGTTYYIKNLFDGQYLTVHDGMDSNSTNVWTDEYSGVPAQKWRVKRNSDGTYSVYAIVSSNNRVLNVNGTNIDIYTYNSTLSCQKFTLVRDTSLAYGGTYKIKNGNSFVVLNGANHNVETSTVGSGLNALWSFEPVVKVEADIYTFYYKTGGLSGILASYFDTTGSANTFTTKCENMGYYAYHNKNKSAVVAYNALKEASIWVFNGHGLTIDDSPAATISFRKDDGTYYGRITANLAIINGNLDLGIDGLSNNELAKAQFVLYMGCSTGVNYNGYNLVSSTFNKGAHFVLGTTQTIYTNDSEKWIKKFFEKADTGATIRQCLDHANYYQSLGLLYYEGDVYTKLK